MIELGPGARSDAYVEPGVHLILGAHSYIGHDTRIVGTGCVEFGDYCTIHRGCFIQSGRNAHVKFGHNCWIGERTVLDGKGGITAGNNIGIGIASHLYSHIEHGDINAGSKYFSKKEMILEDNVWFVGQCLVSPIHAKERSMAMLGSVISHDMEINRIYGGIPAKDLTGKLGEPWTPAKFIDPNEQLSAMQDLIEEYLETRPWVTDSLLLPCIEFPINRDPLVTYFNVVTRTYTKIQSETEMNFLNWATSYRCRFVPEHE